MGDDCGFTAGHDEGMASLLKYQNVITILGFGGGGRVAACHEKRRTDSSSALRTGIASIVWPWGRSLLLSRINCSSILCSLLANDGTDLWR